MNYFVSLLLAAGLPVLGTSPAPAPYVDVPTFQVQTVSYRNTFLPAAVATPQQAYQTLSLVGQATLRSKRAVTFTSTTPNQTTTWTSTKPSSSSNVGANSTTSTSTTTGTSTATSTATSSNGAAEMVALINQARQKAGLKPYTVNVALTTLAEKRAKALATGPFTSDMSVYGWPAQMEQAAGINAQGLGAENIAEAGSVLQAFNMLMASPPHRANILNPYETQIGVGVTSRGQGVFISELFIGPSNP